MRRSAPRRRALAAQPPAGAAPAGRARRAARGAAGRLAGRFPQSGHGRRGAGAEGRGTRSARWIAGATDLGVNLSHGEAVAPAFIALDRIASLQDLHIGADAVTHRRRRPPDPPRRSNSPASSPRWTRCCAGSPRARSATAPRWAATSAPPRRSATCCRCCSRSTRACICQGPRGARDRADRRLLPRLSPDRARRRRAHHRGHAAARSRRAATPPYKVAKRQTDDISIVAAAFALRLRCRRVASATRAWPTAASRPRRVRATATEAFLLGEVARCRRDRRLRRSACKPSSRRSATSAPAPTTGASSCGSAVRASHAPRSIARMSAHGTRAPSATSPAARSTSTTARAARPARASGRCRRRMRTRASWRSTPTAARAVPGVLRGAHRGRRAGRERHRPDPPRRAAVRRRRGRASTVRSSRWWSAIDRGLPRGRRRQVRGRLRAAARRASALDEAIAQESFHTAPARASRAATATRRSRRPRIACTGEVDIGGQEHFYLETQAAWAARRARTATGPRLRLAPSTRPRSRRSSRDVLGLPAQPRGRARCRAWAAASAARRRRATRSPRCAALAALRHRPPGARAARPRPSTCSSPASAIRSYARYEVGFDADGRLLALRRRAVSPTAAGRSISRRRCWTARCSTSTTPTTCRTCAFTGRVAKTNLASNTAFRGFGGPQGMLVIEEILDRIARRARPAAGARARAQSLSRQRRDATPPTTARRSATTASPRIWRELKRDSRLRRRAAPRSRRATREHPHASAASPSRR